MGQVFNFDENKDMPAKSSLDQKMSDVVGEINYNFSKIGNIDYKFSLDHNLNEIKTKYKQGIFSTSLDDLCNNWKLPLPNYLKIDVDGIEFKIISKSKKLLSDKKPK